MVGESESILYRVITSNLQNYNGNKKNIQYISESDNPIYDGFEELIINSSYVQSLNELAVYPET